MNDLILGLYHRLGYSGSELHVGFALRWLEASLLGTGSEAQFEARLRSITNRPIEAWSSDIENAQNNKKYSPPLLDLISFFDSLTIYQNPSQHSALFAEDAQDELHKYNVISTVASSDPVIKQGGLVTAYSESFIAPVQEITAYFDDLEKLLDSVENSHEPIGFLLRNKHQAAAIVYKPTEGWTYWTIQHDLTQKSSVDIASSIMIDFCANNASRSYAEFNVSLILTGQDKRLGILTEALEPRDQTREKERVYEDDKEDTLLMAMISKSDTLLKNVIVLQAMDLNINLLGRAPISWATDAREANKVNLLIQQGVNLNPTDLTGSTPVFYAASNGDEKIVTLLAASGANLNQKNHQQVSPMMIAIYKGYANVVTVLATFDAEMDPNTLYSTVLGAILKGDAEVIAALANKSELNWGAYINREDFKKIIAGKDLAIQNRMNDFFNNTADNEDKLLSLYEFATIIGNDSIALLLRGTHTALLALHKKLGDELSKGVCHGFSVRWLEACFLGEQEEARFEARLQKIRSISTEGLLTQIKEAQDQQRYSPEITDLLGFFASLTLFQNPVKHRTIFSKKINQDDYEGVSAIASSDEIQMQGGLINIYSECFIATAEEIKNYLNGLTEILNDIKTSDTPIGFVLSNKDHSIPLTYQTGRGWFYRDINQKPVRYKNTAIIAEHIIKGFSQDSHKAPPYVAFYINLLITRQDTRTHTLKQKLQTFKERHVITQEITLRQYNEESLLYIATKKGDADLVQYLLDHHNHLNNIELLSSLIHLAVPQGNLALLKTLARPGVSLDQRNSEGRSALHQALILNDEEMVEELARLGANLDLQDNSGWSPLIWAVIKKHENIANILISNEANINLVDKDGWSALFFAIESENENIVQLLVDKGADLNLVTNTDKSALFFAIQLRNENIVQMLVDKGADLNLVANNGWSPLHHAIIINHENIVNILINNRADLNIKTNNGETPIVLTVTSGNSRLLELLIAHGVALDVPDGAIFLAVMLGHTDIIKILASRIIFPKSITIPASLLKIMTDSSEIDVQEQIRHFLKDIKDDEELSLTLYDAAKMMGYDEMADCIVAETLSEKNKNKVTGDGDSQAITDIPNPDQRKLSFFSDVNDRSSDNPGSDDLQKNMKPSNEQDNRP